LEITEIRGKGIDDFIEFPFRLYSKDPLFSPLLRRELRRDFSEKNPFFRHARVRFFIARKEGIVIGRVVSIINRRHIEFHHEKAGVFGFFESIEDYDVARVLLDTVKKELSENGLTIMRGPMNFSTNEE